MKTPTTRTLGSIALTLCLAGSAITTSGQGAAPLRVLVVGGGPDPTHNQVAIESNVRYVGRLLKPSTPMRVLFADGNLKSENVQCQGDDKKIYYRAPQLPRLDGPARSASVQSELTSLADSLKGQPSTRALLYFTGHGSPNRPSNYNNNQYDLWSEETFAVKDLAGALTKFPKETPITLVMVQCFSGAFGNILFEAGEPTGALIDRKVCGFFASVAQRPAAGCTPEINEAEYRDFTGYFFAALAGTDRLGRPITGVDYNHDGRVGMNEAFAYALLKDDSIDTPVCTSDAFLRHFVTTPDEEVFQTTFAKVRSWASPAQLVALDGLAKSLNLEGEDRMAQAFRRFQSINMGTDALPEVRTIRFVRLAKSIVLAHTLTATAAASTKSRFSDLLAAEARNPLKD